MDTWTIVSTFLLGMLVGFFALSATLAILIYLDDKREKDEAVKAYVKQFGGSMDDARAIIYTDPIR